MDEKRYDCEVASQNELIVGNHDSLLLFGSDAQQSLREFSKSVSALLTNSCGDLEYLIHDILNEIDDFQESIKEKKSFPFFQSESVRREKLIKKYDAVLVCIDKMELALKLQEAQLIKDSKILEKLGELVVDSSKKLDEAITYGQYVLNSKPQCEPNEEIQNWYVRLSKRIEDLEISRTVSLQSQAQLKLMRENNVQLVDKILAAVSGTIPVWRNQVTLLLGIERMNRNLEIQNKVASITQGYLEKGGSVKKGRISREKEVDVDKIVAANVKLKKTLDELAAVENLDSKIRLELNDSLM